MPLNREKKEKEIKQNIPCWTAKRLSRFEKTMMSPLSLHSECDSYHLSGVDRDPLELVQRHEEALQLSNQQQQNHTVSKLEQRKDSRRWRGEEVKRWRCASRLFTCWSTSSTRSPKEDKLWLTKCSIALWRVESQGVWGGQHWGEQRNHFRDQIQSWLWFVFLIDLFHAVWL